MEQKIIQEYLMGKSISQLSKEYPLSYYAIQKLLTDNQITIRGGRTKKALSVEDLAHFKEDFFNGVTLKDLQTKYHLDKATLKRIAQENNCQRKNHNRVNKRIISNYFSEINTPEKAYWLGFLFTDGCVNKYKDNQQGRIRLQLQEQDKEILEKYKQDLQIDGAIIYDKRSNSACCSVEFVDDQIFKDLSKYGIVPQKTYQTQHIPINLIPENLLPAFLLGLLDGDGSITCSEDCSKDVTINFTSYYESIVQDFQIAIDKLINKTEHNKNFFTSAWHTQWRGRTQVLKILDILYNNCPRHLNRKYQIYLKIKESLN